MIRFAICDDNKKMTGELESLIMALRPQYNQEFEVSVFFSGEEFSLYLDKTNEEFDIVLMDIEMRETTGIEVGRHFRENIANDLTILIFVSSHQNYYRELLDLNVFAFISKPIFADEFNLKLNRAIERVIQRRELSSAPKFIINKNKRDIHIATNSIMYLESSNRMISLHTESCIYEYYGVLDKEEAKLPEDTFVRIHKSHLINLNHVEDFSAKNIMMKDSRMFSISEKYRENAKKIYMNYRGNDK